MSDREAADTAGWPDKHDPVIGRCGRCGKWYDGHPSGFCPDQIGTDGWVAVGTAEEWRPLEVAGSVDAAGVDARNAKNPAPRSAAPGVREAADTVREALEGPPLFEQRDRDARRERSLAALGVLVAAAERADSMERALEIPRQYDVLVSEAKSRYVAAEAKADTLAKSVIRHGGHELSCPAAQYGTEWSNECDCGYAEDRRIARAALAAAAGAADSTEETGT